MSDRQPPSIPPPPPAATSQPTPGQKRGRQGSWGSAGHSIASSSFGRHGRARAGSHASAADSAAGQSSRPGAGRSERERPRAGSAGEARHGYPSDSDSDVDMPGLPPGLAMPPRHLLGPEGGAYHLDSASGLMWDSSTGYFAHRDSSGSVLYLHRATGIYLEYYPAIQDWIQFHPPLPAGPPPSKPPAHGSSAQPSSDTHHSADTPAPNAPLSAAEQADLDEQLQQVCLVCVS